MGHLRKRGNALAPRLREGSPKDGPALRMGWREERVFPRAIHVRAARAAR